MTNTTTTFTNPTIVTPTQNFDSYTYASMLCLVNAETEGSPEYVGELKNMIAARGKNAAARWTSAFNNLRSNGQGRSKFDPNTFKSKHILLELRAIDLQLNLLQAKANGRKVPAKLLDTASIEDNMILTDSYMGVLSRMDMVNLMEATFSNNPNQIRGIQELSERMTNYAVLAPHRAGYEVKLNGESFIVAAETAHLLLTTPKSADLFQRVPFDTECIIDPRSDTQDKFTYNGYTMVLKGRSVSDVEGKVHKIKGDFRLSMDGGTFRALFYSVAFTRYPDSNPGLRGEDKATEAIFGDADHIPANLIEYSYYSIMKWYRVANVDKKLAAHGDRGYCFGLDPEDMFSLAAFSAKFEYWYLLNQSPKERKALREQHAAEGKTAEVQMPVTSEELDEHPF